MAAIKYTLLRDRRPKDEPISVDLPSGEKLSFRSALSYEDGRLFELISKVKKLENSEDLGLIDELIDEMSVDSKANRKVIKAEPNFADLDTIAVFQIVMENIGEGMGNLGESQG